MCRTLVATLALAGFLVAAAPLAAETVKCQRTIARSVAKLVQAKATALRKCEDAVLRGRSGGPCPDAAAAARIAKAATALAKAIDKACGGDDRRCGSSHVGEDTPASLGWPTACPGFETSACTSAMDDCTGIIQCALCVAEAAVDREIALLYDDLVPSPPGSALNKCQAALGRVTSKYLAARVRLLQKCWDARMKGRHGLDCPDVNDLAPSKLAVKAATALCKACGGADKLCAGGDDFTRAQIGFSFDCPAVQPVTGNHCGIWDPQSGLFELVQCALCVAGFTSDCTDRLAVPQFVPYPPGCGGGPQPTPTPEPCRGTGGLSCAGDCPPSEACLPVSDGVCACLPDGSQPCGDSSYPTCNGTCPPGDTCGRSALVGGLCLCGNPPCGEAPYPTCGGDCPGSDACVPVRVGGSESCWCVAAGSLCTDGSFCQLGSCPPGAVCDFNAGCSCTAE